MDLDSVASIVLALLSTYDFSIEYYTKWQRKQWQTNRYLAHEQGKLSSGGCCGLSTSLVFSGSKIRDAFDIGCGALGEDFAAGDEPCCEELLRNLEQLQECADVLYEAMSGTLRGPLGLSRLLRVSESVRSSTLVALQQLQNRISPDGDQTPPGTERRPSAITLESVPEDDEKSTLRAESFIANVYEVGDIDGLPSPYFKRGPPSPPPTPLLKTRAKMRAVPVDDDDAKSIYAASTMTGYTATTSLTTDTFGPRPRNSVFSIFCTEAMQYQVDPGRKVPSEGRCVCCEYQWRDSHRDSKSEKRDASPGLHRRDWDSDPRTPASPPDSSSGASSLAPLTIKDGFRITPRYLAKSHCRAEHGSGQTWGGYGCVLCTSSGQTGIYSDAEALARHINLSHDKWQMLHDCDLVGGF